MKDNTEVGSAGSARPEVPAAETPARANYHVGDVIIFKFEGNLRARVEGYEAVGGRAWLDARAHLRFLVPPSLVVGVEPGGQGL